MSQSPAKLLPLWDVDQHDDVIVTTGGCLLGCAELVGFDPTQTPEQSWIAVAEALYAGFKQFPEHAYLQFIMEDCAVSDLDLHVPENPNETKMLGYQREKRREYLVRRGMRKTSTHVVYGSSFGLNHDELKKVNAETHRKQLSRLKEVESAVFGTIRRAGMQAGRLKSAKIFELLHLESDTHPNVSIRRENPSIPWDYTRSVREQLIPGDVRWHSDHTRVGNRYYKVLACKQLAPETHVNSLGKFLRPPWNHRIVVHIKWPNQASVVGSFRQRRKFIHSAQKQLGPADTNQEVAQDGVDDLDYLLVDDGQKLVMLGIQAIVWADDPTTLDQRAAEMSRAFANIDMAVYEEANAHDYELFKSLPGMGVQSFERWRLVPSNVAADLVPVANYARGDSDGTVDFQIADTAELFRWNPSARIRANSNFLILGASGSGKSVLTNLILATSMLSGPNRGRVLAVDYAGPTKSSFKVAAEVFGGAYVSISDDGQKINPWPKPSIACKSGNVTPATLAYLTALLNILLHNEGTDKESALFGAIIQQAVGDVYKQRSGDEAPLFGDLATIFGSYVGDKAIDQKRLLELMGLLNKFLAGPEAALLNSHTTAPTDGDFLVYDLYGLKTHTTRIQSAVAFVVANHVRNLAFDGDPSKKKYVLFDEVANLLGLGMGESVEELYTTARAHGCTVGTITQEYENYVRSGIAGVVNLNSTTRILMSHQGAANAMASIVKDFDLNEAEAEAFRALSCVKGEYSESLLKTICVGPGESGAVPVTAKVRLHLSPFDYQLLTSDAADRAKQLALRRKYPDLPQVQILDYLAYGTEKGGRT